MARKFRITIGGVTYNVEVEEIGGAAAAHAPAPLSPNGGAYTPAPAPVAAPVAQRPAAAPGPAPAAAPAPAPVAATPAAAPVTGGEGVKAPLPGTISLVKVEVGQTVAAGQVIAILEAMKMENDITAPVAGTVKEVRVAKGNAVAAGDVLLVIG